MNSAWGKVTINKIKKIDEKLKNNIGKKAKVKEQGKGKDKQLVVTGDPDKVEIESLKRRLKTEKKNVSQLKGNRARRERNIQSAGRAYERRRKKGSLSPRRERRLRPQSAKATIHSRKKKKAPFYTTVKDRSSFSPV